VRSQRPRPRDKFLVSVGNGFRARLDVEAIDAPRMGIVNVAGQRILMLKITSGLRLTFESRRGFPGDWMHASLAHANRNFHHSQAR
jgi:hypothetical protein